jgi:hypothetical protein
MCHKIQPVWACFSWLEEWDSQFLLADSESNFRRWPR